MLNESLMCSQTGIWSVTQTDRQADDQTDKQTDRHTERKAGILTEKTDKINSRSESGRNSED